MIFFESKGSFDKTTKFLKVMGSLPISEILHHGGRMGVQALAAATAIDTGLAASSWYYDVEINNRHAKITWYNNDIQNGYFPVAIMLQYGHGTGTGGYVQGRDYINPAMRPVFDEIESMVWKAVTSA